jgi:hypothetical protein
MTALARWEKTSGAVRLSAEARRGGGGGDLGRAAGVVHQDVEAAEALEGEGDDPVDGVGVADVGGDEERLLPPAAR